MIVLILAWTPPAVAAVPTWHTPRCLGDVCYADLWTPNAAAVARQVLGDAEPQRWVDYDATKFSPEETRELAARVGLGDQVRLWSFTYPQTTGPLDPNVTHAAPVKLPSHLTTVAGLEPMADRQGRLGLRIWLTGFERHDGFVVSRLTPEDAEVFGVAQGSSTGMAPTCGALNMVPLPVRGETFDRSPACVRLPLGDGTTLTGTEWPMVQGGQVTKSCSVHAIGDRVGEAVCRQPVDVEDERDVEHLVQFMYSAGAGPSLVEAWFGVGEQRWVVVNRFSGPSQKRCVAPMPSADAEIRVGPCTTGPPLGGW